MTTIYLAGGQKSQWQDAFINSKAAVEWIDPRTHGLTDEVAYTAWDLAGIRRSRHLIAYLDEANPSGYGMSLEVGYACALGIPVWYVCEDKTARQRFFGMVRSVSNRVFDSLSDAVSAAETEWPAAIDALLALVQPAVSEEAPPGYAESVEWWAKSLEATGQPETPGAMLREYAALLRRRALADEGVKPC